VTLFSSRIVTAPAESKCAGEDFRAPGFSRWVGAEQMKHIDKKMPDH
jgi:hypothetical protein